MIMTPASATWVSGLCHTLTGLLNESAAIQRLDGQFRRAVINTFPYAVAYRVLTDRIEVVAVFPCRIDPDRLADRLSTPPK
jgi:hypothetical protein